MQPTASGGLRADAQRNRDQIVAAAAELFAERGYDAPLEDIARYAGVGIGTLYRRFSGREALVAAVAENALGEVLHRIRAAAASEPRAWDVLVSTIDYSRELRASLRSVSPMPEELRRALATDPDIRSLRADFGTELSALVDRAQREGDLRTDVGAGDVLGLLSLLYRSQDTGGQSAGGLERAAVLLLDGLSLRDRSRLPGDPIGVSGISADWATP